MSTNWTKSEKLLGDAAKVEELVTTSATRREPRFLPETALAMPAAQSTYATVLVRIER